MFECFGWESRMKARVFLCLCCALLAGCGATSFFESKKVDYKSAGKMPPLEIPPT
jgi:uncharacterized lipoprotein